MRDSAVYRASGSESRTATRRLTNLLTREDKKNGKGGREGGRGGDLCHQPPACKRERAGGRARDPHSVCVRERERGRESGQVSVSLSSIQPACVFNEPHPPPCLSPFIRHLFHFTPSTPPPPPPIPGQRMKKPRSPLKMGDPAQLHPDSWVRKNGGVGCVSVWGWERGGGHRRAEWSSR